MILKCFNVLPVEIKNGIDIFFLLFLQRNVHKKIKLTVFQKLSENIYIQGVKGRT